MGSGMMKKEDQRRLAGEWHKALGKDSARKGRKLSRDQLGVVLAGMGIGVQRAGKSDERTG